MNNARNGFLHGQPATPNGYRDDAYRRNVRRAVADAEAKPRLTVAEEIKLRLDREYLAECGDDEPDPYAVTRASHPDTVSRWQAAYARAQDAGLMIRPGLFGGPFWTVTSKSHPDLCYATDGVRCGCFAAEKNDPVCLHRALYRKVRGTLPEPASENVTPISSICSFCGSVGCAMCTDDQPAA